MLPVLLRDDVVSFLNGVHEIGVPVLKIPHVASQPYQTIVVCVSELRIYLLLKEHNCLRLVFFFTYSNS